MAMSLLFSLKQAIARSPFFSQTEHHFAWLITAITFGPDPAKA
jgi:hypothetical protein